MKTPNFSRMIRNYRQEAGLNQEEFAKLVGVGRTSIVAYERGVVKPAAKVVYFLMTKKIEVCPVCDGKGYYTNKRTDLETFEE